LQREAENVVGMAFVLHTLGYVALHEGDLELSRARLEECLVLFQELGDLSGIGDSLEGLAHVAAGRGDDRRAVVLWASSTGRKTTLLGTVTRRFEPATRAAGAAVRTPTALRQRPGPVSRRSPFSVRTKSCQL
jgi:hypothetical protein